MFWFIAYRGVVAPILFPHISNTSIYLPYTISLIVQVFLSMAGEEHE